MSDIVSAGKKLFVDIKNGRNCHLTKKQEHAFKAMTAKNRGMWNRGKAVVAMMSEKMANQSADEWEEI